MSPEQEAGKVGVSSAGRGTKIISQAKVDTNPDFCVPMELELCALVKQSGELVAQIKGVIRDGMDTLDSRSRARAHRHPAG